MLKLDQYELIRTSNRVYKKSIRQIARETGHSRNTIRKALRGEYKDYSERQNQPCPALGAYHELIDGWLKQDKQAPKKQRHTAERIYERLAMEHGYTGGKSTVRRYVREAKIRLGVSARKAFIPSDPECGREAEVDWGTAYIRFNGEEKRIKFFIMRSKYSGKPLVQCYHCERQQAFFDAHMRAFNFFGGIFPTNVYDNLTTAVRKVLIGKKRIEQEAFVKFRSYYSFESRFCNVGKAHEKGGVEGLVGYARRNFLVPIPEVESLDELNERLLEKCLAYGDHKIAGREKTVNELFEEEKEHLLKLPEVPFSNIQIADGKVDKYCTVIADKNHYSVPDSHVGVKVKIELTADRVDIFYGTKKIASHSRTYDNNKWNLKPDHYLDLLHQRPGAFDTARPLKAMRQKWSKSFDELLKRFRTTHGISRGTKDFISVLKCYREYDAIDVEAAVELAVESRLSDFAGVKQLLTGLNPASTQEPLKGWSQMPLPDVSVYAALGGGS